MMSRPGVPTHCHSALAILVQQSTCAGDNNDQPVWVAIQSVGKNYNQQVRQMQKENNE